MRITKQQDIKDCGLHVIQYFIKKHHTKDIEINVLKKEVSFGKEGINLLELSNLADKFGIKFKSYKVSLDDLMQSKIDKEFIAILNSSQAGHYVIVSIKNKIHIKDSIKGEYTMTTEEFSKAFTGIVILQEKCTYKYIAENLKSFRPKLDLFYIGIGLITTLLSIVFTLSSTIFMKIIFDKVLPFHLESTLNVLCIAFGFLVVLRVVNSVLKKYALRYIYLRIELEYKDVFISKLSRISIKDLSKFKNEDIMRRLSYIGSVSSFYSSAWFSIFSESISLIISTSLLIWISPELFGFSLAFAAFILINSLLMTFYNNKKTDDLLENQMNLSANMFYISKNLEMLKQSNYFEFVTKKFNDDFQVQRVFERKFFNFGLVSKSLSELLNLIFPVLITYLSTKLIFENKLTVGEMMLITTATNYLFSSLLEFASFMNAFPQFQKQKKLLDQIFTIKDEETNPKGLKVENISKMSFKNYSFSFDKKIFNLNSNDLNSFRVVGKNGSGKSSLLKCIAGIYVGDGEFKINDINSEYYSLSSLRDSTFYLKPNQDFFGERVIDYITSGLSDSVEIFSENLKKFNLNKLLSEAQISLNDQIIGGGINFSSGQKQIISWLRIFASNYKLILFDEAFENVDDSNFNFIKNVMNKIEINLIEVSHSKKYIRDSQEVKLE